MRSGGRERTAFLPFPKTCLWNKSVPSPFAKGSKTMSRRGVCSSSPVSAPPAAEGEQNLWPLRQSRERDALGSCRGRRKSSTQAGTRCNGKCSTWLPGKTERSGQSLGGARPVSRRAGQLFQVTGVLSEWGIWNLTQSGWAWRRASLQNTETVFIAVTSKQFNSKSELGKGETGREREKMRGGLCLLHLLGLIRGAAASAHQEGRKQGAASLPHWHWN